MSPTFIYATFIILTVGVFGWMLSMNQTAKVDRSSLLHVDHAYVRESRKTVQEAYEMREEEEDNELYGDETEVGEEEEERYGGAEKEEIIPGDENPEDEEEHVEEEEENEVYGEEEGEEEENGVDEEEREDVLVVEEDYEANEVNEKGRIELENEEDVEEAEYGNQKDEKDEDFNPGENVGDVATPNQHVIIMDFSDSTEDLGSVHIQLRSDLSPESAQAILEQLECESCQLYRAEEPGILQGILQNGHIKDIPRGICPNDEAAAIENDCPDWDKECACHGPVMSRGMVGWAGGATGPDFFFNLYLDPVSAWGTQHTVWGEVVHGLDVLEKLVQRPATNEGGMHMMEERVDFTLALEE